MLSVFEDYIKKGIVRKRTANDARARDLIINSANREKFLGKILKKLSIEESDANSLIEQIYDILIELIRAKMFIDGFEATGNYAHEAEVAYLKNLNFLEEEVNLMDEIRAFRNGVKYYGKRYTKEQAEKGCTFMNKLLPKLKKVLELS
jgi:hypothetical protein